ncbi:MAG: YegS/Rv2252/BmrU family lipid kinase [Anaerovoracaceae bacterium]
MNDYNKRKVILFYNPASGNGMFKNNLDYIIERFQLRDLLVIPVRAAHGHAIFDYFESLNKETYKDEFRQVIAAGGDGTINVCVNAMLKNGIDLPLAIFPAGTANDFAYYFELPNDINSMVDIALGQNFTYADVGKINDRYFINVAAIGSVVDVSQKTDPTLKNTLGVVAYYLKGISEFTNLKPVKIKLTTPDSVYNEEMFFMVVMNGRSAGGFKNISPSSEINDGLLDVILFRNMPILDIPPLFFKVLQGNHPDSRNVLHFQASEILIESEKPLPTDIDGEKGEKFPLQFTVLHDRLKLFTEFDNLGE